MIQLPNCSIGRVNGQRKISKTGEDGLYQTAQVGQGNGQKKKSKTAEDGSYHTVQIGLGDRGRKKSKKWIGFDFGFRFDFNNSRNELARPVMGTIVLVSPIGRAKRPQHWVFN